MEIVNLSGRFALNSTLNSDSIFLSNASQIQNQSFSFMANLRIAERDALKFPTHTLKYSHKPFFEELIPLCRIIPATLIGDLAEHIALLIKKSPQDIGLQLLTDNHFLPPLTPLIWVPRPITLRGSVRARCCPDHVLRLDRSIKNTLRLQVQIQIQIKLQRQL
jgi:hypothetical protein